MSATRTIFTVLLCSLPLFSFGQTILVRSGEHANFTRLVLPISSEQPWAASQSGRTISLTFPEFKGDFNVSEVFELIPRTRVAAVNQSEGAIKITLACDCRAATFLTANKFLVLDIAAPNVELAGVNVERSMLETNEPVEGRAALTATKDSSESGNLSPYTVSAVLEKRGLGQATPPKIPIKLRTVSTKPKQTFLGPIRMALLEELSIASGLGLLEMNTRGPENSSVDLVGPSTSQMNRAPSNVSLDPRSDNILVRSFRSGQASDNFPTQRSFDSSTICPEDAFFDVSNWASREPFYSQIGDARRRLFEDSDNISGDAAVRLARLYLYYGFGAEALQVLTRVEPLLKKHEYMKQIGSILDDSYAAPKSELIQFLACPGDVALWALLAKGEKIRDVEIDVDAVLRSLSKLPMNLRQFISPKLTLRLLEFGEKDAAVQALRSISRLPVEQSSALRFAEAIVKIDQQDLPGAITLLSQLANENSIQSPDAIMRKIREFFEIGLPIDRNMTELLGAYSKELSSTSIGSDLRDTHIVSLAKTYQFADAILGLESTTADGNSSWKDSLREKVVLELASHADDVTFLEYFLGRDVLDHKVLSRELRFTVADRLLSLGFPKYAKNLLEGTSVQPFSSRRQILIGSTALRLELPGYAYSVLSDVNDAEADVIRAEAKMMLGEYNEAVTHFEVAGRSEDAFDAAWLGDSNRLNHFTGSSAYQAIAEIQASQSTVDLNWANDSLEQNERALNESEVARKVVSDFLRSIEVEVEIGGL